MKPADQLEKDFRFFMWAEVAIFGLAILGILPWNAAFWCWAAGAVFLIVTYPNA